MFRTARLLVGLLALAAGPAVLAQPYLSDLVGFNGPPIDDPNTCQEMFRTPQFSGATSAYILANTANYDNNAAYRAQGLQAEGTAALEVYFKWIDPADPNAWLRLSTYNGPIWPNPVLDTRGKVRFTISNRSEIWQGRVGVCLGIRETGGADIPQLGNGGVTGPIEWVGATGFHYADPNSTIRVPEPAAWIPIGNGFHLEFDLATGIVKLDGVSQGGGVVGFTGDGVLSAPDDRGVLEHIAFVNDVADAAVLIDLAIDELQFEATVPDPVPPPRIVTPLVAGDTQVTVTDLVADVDQVQLFVNGNLSQTSDVASPADVAFTIPPAIAADVYTARQRSGQSGIVSNFSPPATVYAEPPAYSLALIIDEGGTGSCNYAAPGWEWVGVTATQTVGTYWGPTGLPLFASDAVWQTVDVPLDDDELVLACLGGNGLLAESPTGQYTLDSVWFAKEQDVAGPWEVFLDDVQLIDADGQVGGTLLDLEDGVNPLRYRRGQSQDVATTTEVTDVAARTGRYSHRLVWTYDANEPQALGMLERTTPNCNTSIFIPDTSRALRFHLLCRRQPTNPAVPLPQVVGPVVGNQTAVRVLHETTASSVSLYLDGALHATLPGGGAAFTDFVGLSPAAGVSISATQTVPVDGTSDFAYPRGYSPVPPAPFITAPLLPTTQTVTLTGVLALPFATATNVAVYVNGAPAALLPGGSDTIVVPLAAPLAPGDVVTATQLVNGASSPAAQAVVADTSILREHQIAATLAALDRALSNADLINGQVGLLENGDVDPNNGISAWNANPNSACLEMLNTVPSPGFHPATPPGGLADLTDGVPGSGVEAVLADYYRAALVVRYDFAVPTNVEEWVVFAANEGGLDGRIFQHYDVWASQDGMASFAPLALGVTTGPFGQINSTSQGATYTHVYDGARPVLAEGVTNLRFVFYCVSNTGKRFQDPWQGIANEDAAYVALCPTVEPQDVDGWRKAFEAPIITEIDVFGFRPGDADRDGDLDASDALALFGCLTGPAPQGPPAGNCPTFDFPMADADVDLVDVAAFQRTFTGP